MDWGKITVGAVISAVVIYGLEKIEKRLAMLYLFIVLFVFFLTYRRQIQGGINQALGAVRG